MLSQELVKDMEPTIRLSYTERLKQHSKFAHVIVILYLSNLSKKCIRDFRRLIQMSKS